SLLLAFHFRACTEPLRDLTGWVLHGDRARQMPAVTLVGSPQQPMLDFKDGTGFGCLLPGARSSLTVFGMEHLIPTQPAGCLRPHTGILQPPPVGILDETLRIGRPNHLRHRLQKRCISPLASLQSAAMLFDAA